MVKKDHNVSRKILGRAPTRFDRPFHSIKLQYGLNSISKAQKEKRLTKEDADLICEFANERKAIHQLSDGRVNKITFERALPPLLIVEFLNTRIKNQFDNKSCSIKPGMHM